MPTYPFRCQACGESFERVETIGARLQEDKPRCPKCDSEDVKWVPARFFAVTAKKS